MAVEQLFFTDRPRGKGVDPNRAGYQIKACSPGLDTQARDTLRRICIHHGETVYRHAPKEARDKETQWRLQTAAMDAVPEEVLREFPVVLSYDQIDSDLFAFVRTVYTGITHDGRLGNFFSHALVFDPASLAGYAHNPLTFARSGLFRSSDPSDDTVLQALPDLSGPAPQPIDYELLKQPPYAEHIEALISLLCSDTQPLRPVLLCVPDWRQAALFLEGLLSLLPPVLRCRTTLCTYESDRRFRPEGTQGRRLLTMCGPDDKAFELMPEDYRSNFVVFNLAGNQLSDTEPPSAYARLGGACAAQGQMTRLTLYHDLLDRFGFGADRALWDALVPAAALRGGPSGPGELLAGIECLYRYAKEQRQAQIALELVKSHLEGLEKKGDQAPLVEHYRTVLNLALKVPDTAPLQRRLLTQVFRAGSQARIVPKLWDEFGRQLIPDHLQGELGPDQQKLAEDLISFVQPNECPRENAWLHMRIVESGTLTDDQVVQRLVQASRACAQCQDPEELCIKVLSVVEKRFPKLDDQAVVIGRMADATLGAPMDTGLLSKYLDAITRTSGDTRDAVRKRLADAGGVALLSHDAFNELIPKDRHSWDPDECQRRLKHWSETVLPSHPEILDRVFQLTANALGGEGQKDTCKPLARILLTQARETRECGPGFLSLYAAEVNTLPLQPLTENWEKILLPPPERVEPGAAARISVMKAMRDILAATEKPELLSWTQASGIATLSRDLKALSSEDKTRIANWCLEILATKTATAPQLEAILSALSPRASFADVVRTALKPRDRVTAVLVATALAQPHLQSLVRDQQRLEEVGSVVRSLGAQGCELFQAHLGRRFGPRKPGYEDRVKELLGVVRLEEELGVPPLTPTPAQQTTQPPVRPEEKPKKRGWFGRK